MTDYLHKVPVMQSANGISLSWTPSLFSIENFWLFVGQTQEPILLKDFSNSTENFFCCNSIPGNHITTKFCTYHDSTAVVACAKFCRDHLIRIWMRAKQNCYQIQITKAKMLVKWDMLFPYGVLMDTWSKILPLSVSTPPSGRAWPNGSVPRAW